MRNPVFYIAEGPSFSGPEIALVLLALAALFAAFVFVLVVGIKGFHRLGRGRTHSLVAKVAPLIGLLDLLVFMSTVRESLLFGLVPLVTHAVAFFLGLRARRDEPPPPPASPS